MLFDAVERGREVSKSEYKKRQVDLRVDLDTLNELNDHPGDLAGYGPVIADIARQVAEHETKAEWRHAQEAEGPEKRH